ncbi:glycosyltransferase family 2 protein [Sulfuriflexus mobilis]|uniref:glycosyltransferase family 2 protein n=1 Tax=Sulfuriflexus mobilis TaxID=1811807 RepID=UPI000F837CFF|nr:glycosyltransferase family 2 protein [Sulfuriflexus mobilis]
MSKPEVTILLPNYKTPEITKICLRLLRKYTDTSRIHVIAIDNASGDASLDYLRSLSWIELIERPNYEDESGPLSHSHALDEAMERVTTPYVLSMHTDTFVRRHDWLDFLLARIKADDNIAGVGSWKLEVKPWIKRVLKRIEYKWQSFYFPLVGKGYGKLEGKGDNFLYLRSHCALYRTDLIRKYGLKFSQENDTAGRILHKKLVEHGHVMQFIPSEELIDYMVHLNHATMLLNPELGIRKHKRVKGLKRIKQVFEELECEKVLQDTSLDA